MSEVSLSKTPVEELAGGDQPEEPEVYKPYKVFINHVDSYHSKYISAYVTDQIYGLSKLMMKGGAGEEAPGEEAAAVKPPLQDLPKDKYEFIGTLSSVYREPSEDILYTLSEDDEDFREKILKCGFIIYDITKYPKEIEKALKTLSILTEQLDKISKIGPKTYEQFNETKIFILISTIMTWGLTKPLDPDDPDLPLSEVDYRKRRPHPNYKEHYTCEKEVIKIGQQYKDKLKTYIVCAGLTYGEEEDILDFFFKMAWYNEVLPIFDNGNNRIPFIHVRDLAKALHGLMENAPPKPQYILAVEQTPTTLKKFVKTLSKALGDGKVTNVMSEEAFLYKNMTQTIFERCTVNLNMEPVFLVENLQLEWQSELTIAENMLQVVREFTAKRNLRPVKIIIHGPPGSGKTQLAKKMCEYYNSKYVSIPTMLEDYIKFWKESLVRPEKPKLEETEYLGEEELEEEVEDEEDPQQILEQIREMEMFMEAGVEKMPDDYITGLLRSYLAKNFCQNRGYVLDDYPRLPAQAKELFGQSENMGGEEEEMEAPDFAEKILPNLVVGLVATDEFITERMMKMQEEEIKDTPYAEEIILERLREFRENNTDENTVLNYFDELEIDILLLEAKDDDNEEAFTFIANQMGPPSTFGLTPEEEEELRTIQEQERQLALEKEELSKQLELEKAEEERKNKMEAWSETLEKLQMEEEKILVAQSEPLRHYLMKYVFPVLTKGLIELATLKPDDPVDFLAEYLFKENPEGKMFDPSYNVECEDLYTEFRGYIDKIIDENEAFD
ncbi:adenylate kinase 7-like [Tribolium madens]|uniref:adenylate kinase 7-like n=1 Tax=Tribolium madens TaxID=41895 RepID=UPI001CF76432|nr:adenylate kinase 7-like [Tribolium madens]